MSLFSQRKGIRPLQKAIQREAIDDDLRNKLWTAIKLRVFDHYEPPGYGGYVEDRTRVILQLVQNIWVYLFKHPVDTIPNFERGNPSAYTTIRDYFFRGDWWQLFDFIEFVVARIPPRWALDLRNDVNLHLEAEAAAYRLVDTQIVEITDTTEIAAIETALEQRSKAAQTHLIKALELLSDKNKPDFRNSIKESISAVEATCQIISGDSKATLGNALKMIQAGAPLHGAFAQALGNLYGYTSDGGGIRHSLNDKSESPSYGDAKFMLVVCSAFVNYLWIKAAEANLKIKT